MKKKMNKAIAGITAAAMFFSGAMFSPGVMTLVYADEMAEDAEFTAEADAEDLVAEDLEEE